MRLPRVRLTVRTMMATVAVAAVLAYLYLGLLAKRSAHYSSLAEKYRSDLLLFAAGESRLLEAVKKSEGAIADMTRHAADAEKRASEPGQDLRSAKYYSTLALDYRDLAALESQMLRHTRKEAAHRAALRVYHQQLEAKYRYAAAHPWQPAAADPPYPK
jgi:hypothetical protein